MKLITHASFLISFLLNLKILGVIQGGDVKFSVLTFLIANQSLEVTFFSTTKIQHFPQGISPLICFDDVTLTLKEILHHDFR